MKLPLRLLATCTFATAPVVAMAESAVDLDMSGGERAGIESGNELPPYLQCVPYAREVSGIGIYGDALSWWDQAAGRYQRGSKPKVGAVMAFQPYGNLVLGHVAAVSRIIDSRTVLLNHANWSPIDGRRGQIERNVRAVDVSPANDWSQVRVWYAPLQDLGTTAWPVAGFIYGNKAGGNSGLALGSARLAQAGRPEPVGKSVSSQPVLSQPVLSKPSRAFSQAFADLAPAARPVSIARPQPANASKGKFAQAAPRVIDPINAAIARYEK